jgi:PAS domain S-box-containing protein
MTDKMNLDETGRSASILRHRAEGKISRSPDTTQNLKGKTRAEIIHELQVHQIELEMQNEELKRVQFELEKSRDQCQDKYQNLYHVATVGYFTLTRKGLIKEVNLFGAALFGIPRQELIGRGFGYFVAPESLHLWDKLIVAALGHEEKQSCDLTLKREDESSFSAHLDTKRIDMPIKPQKKTGETLSISMVVSDISERIWMENELRSGKEEWERTFNGVPDLIAFLNDGYKIIRVNRAMAQQLGLEAQDCIGMHCYKAVHRTDAPPTCCPHRHLLRDGKEHSVEVHEDYLGGDYLVTASPLRDADSRVVGSVLVARDISERKRVEAEIKALNEDLDNRVSERTAELILTNRKLTGERESLRRTARSLKVISQCNKAMIQVEDEIALFDKICRLLVEVGGYRMAWVGYALEDEARTVQPVAHVGFEKRYLETVKITWADEESGHGPNGTAIRTGRPQINRNSETNPSYNLWRTEATSRGYASSIALPLSVNKRVIGALTVYASEPDAFDQEELELLTQLADDVSYGITALRTRLEREQAQQELDRMRQRHELILTSAWEGIFGLGLDGNYTFVNPAAAKMLGREARDLIGQRCHLMSSQQKAEDGLCPEEGSRIPSMLLDGVPLHLTDEVLWTIDGAAFPV